MISLPVEIWILIAHHLSNNDLRVAFCVNQALFHAYMDRCWGKVILETQDMAEAMHLLERLSDPFVAYKVNDLVLRFNNHKLAKPFRQLQQHLGSALRGRIKTTVDFIKHALRRSREPDLPDVVEKLIICVPGFVNVHILDIESCQGCIPQTYDLTPLFKAFWAAFGGNLMFLNIISGSVETYRSILLSTPVLTSSLQGLTIDFSSHNFSEDRAIEKDVICSLVAPFVKSLSAYLVSLCITCHPGVPWDMSPVFIECNSFPCLQNLFISMEVEEGNRNLIGLEKIVSNSKALRRLQTYLFPSLLNLDDGQLSRWHLKCLQEKESLGQLQELEIFSEALGWGALSTILAYIKRTSATLCRLTIRGRYLVQEEITAVIKAASDCPALRYFSFNICVCCFKIQVIDDMAVFLPNLEGLSITLSPSRSECEHATLWSEFTTGLETRTYNTWKLKAISICHDNWLWVNAAQSQFLLKRETYNDEFAVVY